MAGGWDEWHRWFAAERKGQGWTQESFAHAAGIGVRMVGHYERGTKHPRPATIAAIERILGGGPAPELSIEEWASLADRVSAIEDELAALRRAIAPAAGVPSRADAVRAGVQRADAVARRVRGRAQPEDGEEGSQRRRSSG